MKSQKAFTLDWHILDTKDSILKNNDLNIGTPETYVLRLRSQVQKSLCNLRAMNPENAEEDPTFENRS